MVAGTQLCGLAALFGAMLVLIPPLGLTGAALATVVGEFVGLSLSAAALRRRLSRTTSIYTVEAAK